MKIAIIGSGISGMVAAHKLYQDHDITLFESNDYIGGHTNTIDVEYNNVNYAVDTGFIVFNDWTYPNFIQLLNELNIESQASNMGFSVKCDDIDFEYSGDSLNTLFVQRRNLLSPKFYKMLLDITRFNKQSILSLNLLDETLTLGEYLKSGNYSALFIEKYIIPMGAAIWSAEPADMYQFPARYFISFFKNHGLLSINDRPTWRVIKGGSKCYIEKLITPFKNQIKTNCPVKKIERHDQKVTITTDREEDFDYVFIACHSDQALSLLNNPSQLEKNILSAIPYQKNEAILHTDSSVLPKRKHAWAAWNYHLTENTKKLATVTYNMNILQSLNAPVQFCVSLNYREKIDPNKIIKCINYDHPVYHLQGIKAQQQYNDINSHNRTYYCGAYWGHGFHEDGVKSALSAYDSFEKNIQKEQAA